MVMKIRFTSYQPLILRQQLTKSGETRHQATMVVNVFRWRTLFTRLVWIHHVTPKRSTLELCVAHISSALTIIVGNHGDGSMKVLNKQKSGRRRQMLRPNNLPDTAVANLRRPNVFRCSL